MKRALYTPIRALGAPCPASPGLLFVTRLIHFTAVYMYRMATFYKMS